MATNDLLLFGTAVGANVIDQAAYEALSARLPGFSAGVAKSNEVNKALRQAAFAAAMIGQFTADYSGDNVVDNGDVATFEASFLKAILANATKIPTGDVTLYVRTDGNDSNNGSANTADSAFATILAAVRYGLTRFNIGGYALNIQLGNAGTYAPPGAILSAVTINIIGDVANQGNFNISGVGPGGGGSGLIVSQCRELNIKGVTLTNTSNINATAVAGPGAQITFTNVTFAKSGGSTTYSILTALGGVVAITTGCIIAGGVYAAAFNGSNNGQFSLSGLITVTGTPAFNSAFVLLNNCATLGVYSGATISGAATGTRYSITRNAVCDVNGSGANYFPGSGPGTTATGGIYN